MTHTELQALKIILDNFDVEAKRGDKASSTWTASAEAETDEDEKRRLKDEASFSRGLACGYGLARNQLGDLIKAVEKDLTPRREY